MQTEKAWLSFKRKYAIGSSVSGRIVHKAPFGIFLDIGESFLALLEITQMTPQEYNSYQVGGHASGILADFTDHNQQMRLRRH